MFLRKFARIRFPAREESRRLQLDPKVQQDVKAGALWRRIENLRGALEPHEGSVDPACGEFRKKNQAAIERLTAQCRLLVKTYPDTAAAVRSRALLTRYH